MANSASDLPLASEFPAASHEQWRKLVDAVLKGRDFDKTLVSRTYDQLRIQPLYERRPDARPIAGRPQAAPWQVMARVDHPDPVTANQQALEDLQGGATGLTLVCPGAIGCYGFGIDTSESGIERILDGVYLDGIALELCLTRAAKDAPNHVAAAVKRAGLAPEQCDLRCGYDPLGLMAAGRSSPSPWRDIAPVFTAIIRDFTAKGFRGPFAAADGRPVHEAGGSEAQELAFALGNALAYLRALEQAGVALDDARSMIFFRLAADADQFLTMAKFRAIRKLWARVEEACGLDPKPAFVSAETAWRMMTRRDVYVNMLRVTIAAFSAGLGGADAISILPFTAALGLPDAFARRIARNTQAILLEESNLAKVADPAAGSGGIEDLTDQLCRSSWTLFQEIEAAGGAAAAIEAGLIQGKVAQTRSRREKAVATRRDPVTGTSKFPHLSELPVVVLDAKPAALPAPSSAILAPMRLAEPYEKLRDASDRALERTGVRPKIFLANLGKPADFIARATFARNFFEAGGIEAINSDETHTSSVPAELKNDIAAAFKSAGAQLACLCSSDEVYAREAENAARALASAGAKHIYLAGRPKNAEALQKSGVNTFVYTGCDALATLRGAHDILGITQ